MTGSGILIVSGVLGKIPRNSTLQFDYLLSYEIAPAWMKSWDVKTTPVFVRLRDSADPADVGRKIAGVLDARHPDWHNTLKLQPLTEIHLHELGGGGRILYVYVFSALALVVLLIAVINFMNLSTARAEKRAKEIGIKKVLGSRRSQLIGQFLIESTIFAFLALVLAAVFVKIALPRLNALLMAPVEMRLTWPLAVAVLGITLLTGLLAGSYPAFLLSSFAPVTVFKGRRGRSRGASLRKILVVGQLALSAVFIVSVLVLNSQMRYIRNRDLGFDKTNVVMLELQGALSGQSAVLKETLSRKSERRERDASASHTHGELGKLILPRLAGEAARPDFRHGDRLGGRRLSADLGIEDGRRTVFFQGFPRRSRQSLGDQRSRG